MFLEENEHTLGKTGEIVEMLRHYRGHNLNTFKNIFIRRPTKAPISMINIKPSHTLYLKFLHKTNNRNVSMASNTPPSPADLQHVIYACNIPTKCVFIQYNI
jgi:hypothetical protein